MRTFAAAAPGAIWTAVILGLTLGAIWLNDYMGDLVPVWLPPLILTVLVPVIKVVAFGPDEPAGVRSGEVTVSRSKFSRWLL